MNKVFEKIIEKLKDAKSNVPVNRLLDDIIKDKPKELGQLIAYNKAIEIVKNEAEQYNNGWIPFVQREMTEDEKESFGDLNFMLDCQLPDEDEEILITYKFKDELYVDVDTFMRDGSECYLDSGRDFVTEAVAWRKKPQPFQPKGEING